MKRMSEFYQYKHLSKYEGLIGKLPIRAGTTYIGVEIELEEVRLKNRKPPSSFNIVTDGSLRNNGKEFTTVPIHACYVEEELKRLFLGLDHPKISSRCSIHVHLNMRDVTEEELLKFLLLYLIFERSLYRFSGDRWNNLFCVPLSSYPKLTIDAIKALMNTKELGIKKIIWNKYTGLNLTPLWGEAGESKFGTVEFRQMEGTLDIPRIINWINLIISLKISAKMFLLKQIKELLLTMNSTSEYYQLTETVFKDWYELIENQPTFKEDVENSITKTKVIAFKSDLI